MLKGLRQIVSAKGVKASTLEGDGHGVQFPLSPWAVCLGGVTPVA